MFRFSPNWEMWGWRQKSFLLPSWCIRKPAALCVHLRAELGPKPGGFRVSPSSLPTMLRGRSPLSARAPLAAEAPCLPVCLWPSGCAVWAAPVVRGNRALLLLCLHPGSPWEQISRAGDSRSHEKPVADVSLLSNTS